MHSRSQFFPTFLAGTVGVLLGVLMASVDAHAVTLRWSRTYNGPSNGNDHGRGVATSADGSVYVTGSYVARQSVRLVLRKYSPSGTVLWTRTYGRFYAAGHGVAVAASGNIYVTGESNNDLLLQKYSPSGVLLWTKTYNGGSGQLEAGNGVAVAAGGAIYVTGYTHDVDGEQSANLLLQKYSPSGALLWARTYNGASNGQDEGLGVAVATGDVIYVTGFTEAYPKQILLLQKYSPIGDLLWTQTYNGTSSYFDVAYGVAAAADGSIYLTGETDSVGQRANLLLQKYSPIGDLLWTQSYNGVSNDYDRGLGVAVAADGSIYVTGHTATARRSDDLLLQKYSPSGVLIWTKTYNGAFNGPDIGNGVAVAAGGSIYLTGYTDTARQSDNLLLQKYK